MKIRDIYSLVLLLLLMKRSSGQRGADVSLSSFKVKLIVIVLIMKLWIIVQQTFFTGSKSLLYN